jgi:hypothetical protein
MPTQHQHQQQLKVRKGANGVLLKKFETVLRDIYSSEASSIISSPTEIICPKALQTLTPRYSKLPPFLDESEQDNIVQRARRNSSSSSLIWCKNEQLRSSSPWPFDERTALPSCGCVRDNSTQQRQQHRKPRKTKTGKDVGGVGDIYGNHQRALRKEMQLANMIQCVFSLLPDHILHPVCCEEVQSSIQKKKRKFRIVDFAGGTGHLSVPLALLLPHCEVVCVDLKKWSLDLLHRRVDGISLSGAKEDEELNDADDENRDKEADMSSFHQNTLNGLHKSHNTSNTIRVSQNIPNLSTYLGSIQSYNEYFDIGISLHACGEASDYVLRKCFKQKASWVVCSCCCGKLQSNALNPYTFQSTGINEKGVSYPQSKSLASFMNVTVDDDDNDDDSERRRVLLAERFDEVARAADYSELGDVRKPRNACRRAAKSLVEWDRLLYCKEYDADDADSVNVVLTRMVPWEASTKNDILIGWYDHSCNPYRRRDRIKDSSCNAGVPEEDPSSQVDFEIALQHLFGGHGLPAVEDRDNHANDWSPQEVTEIQMQLEAFLSTDMEKTFRFQRGMGSRKRKLIHYVAEKMGLRHWGEGKKDSEKIVVVARRKIE